MPAGIGLSALTEKTSDDPSSPEAFWGGAWRLVIELPESPARIEEGTAAFQRGWVPIFSSSSHLQSHLQYEIACNRRSRLERLRRWVGGGVAPGGVAHLVALPGVADGTPGVL